MKQTDPKLTGFRVGFKWFPPTLSGADSAIGHALDMGWGEPIIRDWVIPAAYGLNLAIQDRRFRPFDAAIAQKPGPVRNPTPCADMAQAYQAKRDEWVNNWESQGQGHSWTVYDFDKSITPTYIGKVVQGDLNDNYYFYATKGGVGSVPKTGQQDFQDKYLDADYPRESTDTNADQVHHFAAYFSAGINGAYWSATTHAQTDGWIYRSATSVVSGGTPKKTNYGDVYLGNDAYAFGVEVRRNPLLLKTIGDELRRRFCR